MIHNAVPIAGVELPFVPSSTDCSVVGDPELLVPFRDWLVHYPDWDEDPNRCCPLVVTHPSISTLEAGDHAFLEVTFTISAEAEAQTITVDDYSWIGPIPLVGGEGLHAASFAGLEGNTIMIEFTPGEIIVVAPE